MITKKATIILTFILSTALLTACDNDKPTGPEGPTVLRNKIIFTKKVSHSDENDNTDYLSYDLHTMDPDGSVESTLKDTPDTEGFFPDISPDGTQVVYMFTQPDAEDDYGNIALINADGAGYRILTSSGMDAYPRWMPEGNRIIFHSKRSGNYEIYIMNADGSGQVPLTNNESEDIYPEITLDGSLIYFISNRDGDREIYTMNPDGNGSTKITDNNVLDSDAIPSPDGGRLAFISDRDGTDNLYVMNADGSTEQLTFYTEGSARHPTWSPDGSRIAFGYGDLSSIKNDGRIFIIGSNGGTPVALTKAESSLHPSWSPVE